MKPSIGRTVIYVQPEHEQPVNATREHPAVITRVCGDGDAAALNLQVAFDAGETAPRTSVLPLNSGTPGLGGWKWPDRV